MVVIQRLRQFGFEGPFGGGRHVIMRHPISKVKIPIPIHGNRDLPVGTIKAILREAGISPEKWQEK